MTNPQKIYYGNSTAEQKEKIEKFIDRDLGNCQSLLIDMLLQKEIFTCDDIENMYPDCSTWTLEKCKEWFEEYSTDLTKEEINSMDTSDIQEEIRQRIEPQEIYEWWNITNSSVKDDLLDIGEPIIDNNYGMWWGRTCTGQSILLDPTFWDIYQKAI